MCCLLTCAEFEREQFALWFNYKIVGVLAGIMKVVTPVAKTSVFVRHNFISPVAV